MLLHGWDAIEDYVNKHTDQLPDGTKKVPRTKKWIKKRVKEDRFPVYQKGNRPPLSSTVAIDAWFLGLFPGPGTKIVDPENLVNSPLTNL